MVCCTHSSVWERDPFWCDGLSLRLPCVCTEATQQHWHTKHTAMQFGMWKWPAKKEQCEFCAVNFWWNELRNRLKKKKSLPPPPCRSAVAAFPLSEGWGWSGSSCSFWPSASSSPTSCSLKSSGGMSYKTFTKSCHATSPTSTGELKFWYFCGKWQHPMLCRTFP